MGKYGNLEVNVKVFEAKMEPSVTSKGGVFQNIGNCHAEIKSGDMVLFEDLQGRLSRFFRSTADFENGENPNLIVDYSNSIKLDSGTYYEKVRLGKELAAILQIETIKSFNEGFAKSERDEEVAKIAGMDMSEYDKLMKEAMSQAGKISGSLKKETEKTSNKKDALAKLDSEIG